MTRPPAVLALLVCTLALCAPESAAAQRQEAWGLAGGVRAGVYAPSAALLGRTYALGGVEGEIGYGRWVALEGGVATGRPPFLLRLQVGHAPSMDLSLWRARCGRGPACSLGAAEGGITTAVAEVGVPITPLAKDWDLTLVGGAGLKRYGWKDPGASCEARDGSQRECLDARALSAARSVFTVHLAVESAYELRGFTVFVEMGDYLSGFGVRTQGSAEGQFQNDLILAAGVRLLR